MKKFFYMVLSYLRRHITVIIAVLIAVLTFLLVFSLYELPVEAVLYASALSIAAILILGIIRFAAYYKRHQTLRELQAKLINDLNELPHPISAIEEDYQELIRVLNQSRAMLISKADREKSDMIDYYTTWAHQIKTPIATLNLLLQEEDREETAQLRSELFKIEQYVEMVLSYLRIESSSSDYVFREYELDCIVRQAVRKYAKLFIGKKIGFDYNEIDCKVLTDEKWLLFVIEQIFSNAIKYTKEGTISVYLTENKTLVIEDTGIGISPEDLPRVFEKGYTGYNGRADKKSTGIGLYLCKRIITKLGHSISIESAIDSGTKVKIGLDTINFRME